MRPANDPEVDYKDLVRRSYDRCSAAYDQARRQEPEPALSMLINRLDEGAVVLDVGCGAGVPVARELAQYFTVTGVDFSGTMINRARENVPTGTFIEGDIMSVDFPPAHFDAVVAVYSIFHLPREEHAELFRRIYRWLKPEGYLMATVSFWNEVGYIEDDFFGATMYWSNHALDEYKEILEGLGFSLLEATIIGHGYDDSTQKHDESHPLVFTQKGDG